MFSSHRSLSSFLCFAVLCPVCSILRVLHFWASCDCLEIPRESFVAKICSLTICRYVILGQLSAFGCSLWFRVSTISKIVMMNWVLRECRMTRFIPFEWVTCLRRLRSTTFRISFPFQGRFSTSSLLSESLTLCYDSCDGINLFIYLFIFHPFFPPGW